MGEPFKFSISDLIAVGQLAYTLYRKCYQAARNAPPEFQRLISELNALKTAMEMLEEEAKNKHSLLFQKGQDRTNVICDVIDKTRATLLELENCSNKYDRLLDTSRPKIKHIWDKVKWAIDMPDIDSLRSKLSFSNGVIQLLLTAAGNSSLQNMQSSWTNIEGGVSRIEKMITKSENASPALSIQGESDLSRKKYTCLLMERAEVSGSWTAIGINEWIKAGRWWLLRYRFQILADPRAISEEKCVSPTAYAILIKASWILGNVIKVHPQLDFLRETIRCQVEVLVMEISEEFNKINHQGLRVPQLKDLDHSQLYIWEELLLDIPPDPISSSGKSPIKLIPSLSSTHGEDNRLDIWLETFGYFQYPTGRLTPCLIQLLLHKADMKPRLMIFDQAWKILVEVDVNPETRPTINCKDRIFLIEGQRIVTGTDIEAQALHVLLSTLVEYVWWYQSPNQPGKQSLASHNIRSLLEGFAMLFAVGFGYYELIDSRASVENIISQLPDRSSNNRRLNGQDPMTFIKQAWMIMTIRDTENRGRYRSKMKYMDLMKEEIGGRGEVLVSWLQETEVHHWLTAKLIYTKIAISLNINACWQEALYDGDIQEEAMRLWQWYSQNTNDFLHKRKEPYLGSIFIALALRDGVERQAILKRLCVPQACNGMESILTENLKKEINIALVRAAADGIETVIAVLVNCVINVSGIQASARALQVAAGSGHKAIVRIMLEAGTEVNALPGEYNGRTALQAAADSGHEAIVRILLKAGAEVNALPGEYCGRTALQGAAGSGHEAIVRILLEAGAEVNALAAENDGVTALQAAAGAGHETVVRILLGGGAEVNAMPANSYGRTALQAAVSSGHEEIVRILLEAGAEVNAPPANSEGMTALQAAAGSRHEAIVRILLEAGASVNALPAKIYGKTALQAAAGSGYEEIVRILLEAGAEVNALPAEFHGSTALQAAAGSGHETIVRILLEDGAEVNAMPANSYGRTALQAAAASGHEAIVRILLEAGAEVNALPANFCGRTALQGAAGSGHEATVRILLEAGADVNTLPAKYDRRTALQAAAGSGHEATVRILLQAGANVNALPAKTHGRTALQAAAGSGYEEIVRILLEAGASVNALPAKIYGKTALQAAAGSGDEAIVRILLEAGAKVNAPPAEDSGRTALQVAAGSGHEAIVRILLEAGAEVNALPAELRGQTALKAAAANHHYAIEEILRNAGARE